MGLQIASTLQALLIYGKWISWGLSNPRKLKDSNTLLRYVQAGTQLSPYRKMKTVLLWIHSKYLEAAVFVNTLTKEKAQIANTIFPFMFMDILIPSLD